MTDDSPSLATLVDANTRDKLLEIAASYELDIPSGATKIEIAEAILAANPDVGNPEVEPSSPEETGRPPLVELAEQRAAEREKRLVVIGEAPSPDQED